MIEQATIAVPQKLYERVHRLAQRRQQPVAELIADFMDLVEEHQVFEEASAIDDWSEPNEAVDREMKAYVAMHPQLKQQFLGKHVAIYGGELIDMDDNFAALYARIDAKYPDEFVWLTPVEEEAIPTIVVRSPRFDRE
jgi:Family of unknown function (DUF5678)